MSASKLYDEGFKFAKMGFTFKNEMKYGASVSAFENALGIFMRLASIESKSKKDLLLQNIEDFKLEIKKLTELLLVDSEFQSTHNKASRAAREQQNNDTKSTSDCQPHKKLLACLHTEHLALMNDATCSNSTRDRCLQLAERYIAAIKEVHAAEQHICTEKIQKLLDKAETIGSRIKMQQFDEERVLQKATIKLKKHNKKAQYSYSQQELDVLRRSSRINGRIYLPWMEVDLDETFAFEQLFTDPDGLLTLSTRQASKFAAWRRPHQFCVVKGGLKLINTISPYSIKQDLVTDCSFVASLCITAAYERRFNKRLISNIIYPQDSTGHPIYNRSGKYLVKLWFNGVPRKVIVDDLLPVDRHSTLLCSSTLNCNELWVTIVEKAYLKVNGGYDFPGSNSGIDLFALTGWIPESLSIDPEKCNYQNNLQNWSRLRSAHKFGDCLITLATGDLSDKQETELGLVKMHAYAVLDVFESKTGHRLLKVKNPWRKVVWRGKFSKSDTDNWTSKLLQELPVDSEETKSGVDEGLFWIDYNSVCLHFRGLFLNWNPDLFSFRTAIHKHWAHNIGPRNDSYNMGYNPQYTLIVHSSSRNPQTPTPSQRIVQSVWILLTRHVVDKNYTEANQQDHLTLHVYSKREGRRVYYPENATLRGAYSNNPHYLVCIDVPPGEHRYTLVTSQYEKLRSIDYTMSVYATAPFRLSETSTGPRNRLKFTSKWSKESAGGNAGLNTYTKNPRWKVYIASNEFFGAYLSAPPHMSINIGLYQMTTELGLGALLKNSGDYRSGFCYIEVDELLCGDYVLVASTYYADCYGNLELAISSSCNKLKCEPLENLQA